MALYRVHLIVNANGFINPRSFRTEEQADTFEEAWGAAQKSLRAHAAERGWADVQTLSYASCERVPQTA